MISSTCVPPSSRSTPRSRATRADARHASGVVDTTSMYEVAPAARDSLGQSLQHAGRHPNVLEADMLQPDGPDQFDHIEAVLDGAVVAGQHEDEIHHMLSLCWTERRGDIVAVPVEQDNTGLCSVAYCNNYSCNVTH